METERKLNLNRTNMLQTHIEIIELSDNIQFEFSKYFNEASSNQHQGILKL